MPLMVRGDADVRAVRQIVLMAATAGIVGAAALAVDQSLTGIEG